MSYMLEKEKERVIKGFADEYPDAYDMLVEILGELSAKDLDRFVEVTSYEVEREKMKR